MNAFNIDRRERLMKMLKDYNPIVQSCKVEDFLCIGEDYTTFSIFFKISVGRFIKKRVIISFYNKTSIPVYSIHIDGWWCYYIDTEELYPFFLKDLNEILKTKKIPHEWKGKDLLYKKHIFCAA